MSWYTVIVQRYDEVREQPGEVLGAVGPFRSLERAEDAVLRASGGWERAGHSVVALIHELS
jgi:hypothetical protein